MKPMKPAIGIPECHDAKGRIRPGREYLYNDIAYAQAIGESGGSAFHLPIQDDPLALVERIDALLLPGGDDFLPETPYPEDVRFNPASELQVAFDRELLVAALERRIPILGICYGAQLLALEFGGSLHYDLGHDMPDAQDHQLDEAAGRHELTVEKDSRLASLLGSGQTQVNSLHHQAIAQPGPELRVVARARDGVVEAVEHPARDFCIGVQWHPEKLPVEANRWLFGGLVAAAAEFAAQ
jgi:putative glutamine amidotransferase